MTSIGLPFSVGRAPKVLILNWKTYEIGCVEANSNGLSKGNSGSTAACSVFRACSGSFLGGYCIPLGDHIAYYDEIVVAIFVIVLAYSNGWRIL